MNSEIGGQDLFIVDNSVSGWTGIRYLEEWTEIATGFDIATGFFEIGALLALDRKWQRLEKIRVLMGAETTHRTRKALHDYARDRAIKALDESMEGAKDSNPFLDGVPAILEALRSGKIECRIYDKDKFHAKAYITHAKFEVGDSRALVGSSNFTYPGLAENIELNVQIQSANEVMQLQEWFDVHWGNADKITDIVIDVVERHIRRYLPFDVYAKALQEFFRNHELTGIEWDETHSKIYPRIDRYQKEAYWALMKIARQHGGAFLCDGVGLGKTFVGLMLIERLVLHEGKRVVLFAPKATKEGVWEPHLQEWLPHIGGVGGGADFSNLAVFSHTDLNRKGDFPERFKRIAELADVFIIDEAHHFRNPGSRGDPSKGKDPSRYYRLYNLLDNDIRPKTMFMLTATPINNRLSDFRHMVELFTRHDQAYFGQTLGINHLQSHFNQMERDLREHVGHTVTIPAEEVADVQNRLAMDTTFRELVVQRSRDYARTSQIQETGEATAFPNRESPRVAEYSVQQTYGRLLDMLEFAFKRENPLFSLPMYYPLHWYKGPDQSIDSFEQNRQKQVVGLIRTNFLKRFESSVAAFELSCTRLLKKLLAFVDAHSETDTERKRLERWKSQNVKTLRYAVQCTFDLWEQESEEDEDEDIVPQEMLEAVDHLDRTEYKVEEMLSETFLDLDQIVQFLNEIRTLGTGHDDKLKKLTNLLLSEELANQKVLIFTEFADTARYLKRHLEESGIDGIAQVDSATKTNRRDVIQRFSPYYNGTSSKELAADGKRTEIRVLISTDVLSEGLNLQDASRMINYDIHWNPVRLMQRIGRVDRRMAPEVEKRLVSDHPEVTDSRGTVSFWNFLPPNELNRMLTLYTKVTQKTLLISKTLGIEGRKLLRPDDLYDDLKVMKGFETDYEGTRTAVENMNLEYQALLIADPELEARLRKLPGTVFSGRERPAKGVRGVFFCYALPALDRERGEFTEEAGTTRWYLYDLDLNTILEEPGEINASIHSKLNTPRKCTMEKKSLIEVRIGVEKHIKNNYMKRINAPLGVKPVLRCWMELNEG